MARKREPEKHANHERWLVSYGDLLTLLLAVFVVMYAMSVTDKQKAEQVAASLRESFGMVNSGAGGTPVVVNAGAINIVPGLAPALPPAPPLPRVKEGRQRELARETDFAAIKASLDAYLVKSGYQDKVAVNVTRRGVVVSLKEAGFFDSGSARLRQDSIQPLRSIAETLGRYSNRFRVEGHTDTVPIRSAEFRSNWELSTARATQVIHYLVDSAGFEPQSLTAVGYGEYQPVVANDTSEGRARNRRVDIVLLAADAAVGEGQGS